MEVVRGAASPVLAFALAAAAAAASSSVVVCGSSLTKTISSSSACCADAAVIVHNIQHTTSLYSAEAEKISTVLYRWRGGLNIIGVSKNVFVGIHLGCGAL